MRIIIKENSLCTTVINSGWDKTSLVSTIIKRIINGFPNLNCNLIITMIMNLRVMLECKSNIIEIFL